MQELTRKKRENLLEQLYPDEGPLRRALYPKHIAFFRATDKERAAIAANRIGKTLGIGGYELTRHLLGIYPEWWEGKRYTTHAIEAWAAGDTGQTTRDIVQHALLGPPGRWGEGLIPKDKIIFDSRTSRPGIAGAVDTISIKHSSGMNSLLGFKSYDQKRRSFQGTAKDVVWCDEEPPGDVYDECMMRLMTTDGLMLCTFTPLLGLSDVALRFLPDLAPEIEDE